MTRKELMRAQVLADELVRRSRGENQVVAEELRALLEPVPTLSEILLRIPGETHRERMAAVELSPQGYYNLLHGRSRPSGQTVARLSKLTGLSFDRIMEAPRLNGELA